MTPAFLFKSAKAILFVVVLIALASTALAQGDAKSGVPSESATSTTKPKPADSNPAITPKYTTPTNPLDEAYGAKIKEFTTEKYFLTELVDHLPASSTIPSPEKILGYAVGTPNKLTHVADLNRYYRALAAASPRVRVLVAPEKSEEGREQLLVIVSDEASPSGSGASLAFHCP